MYTEVNKATAMQAYFDNEYVGVSTNYALTADQLKYNLIEITDQNMHEYFASNALHGGHFWIHTPSLKPVLLKPESVQAIDQHVWLEYPNARVASKVATYLKSLLQEQP